MTINVNAVFYPAFGSLSPHTQDRACIFDTNMLLTQIITGFLNDTSFILNIMMQKFDILQEQDQQEGSQLAPQMVQSQEKTFYILTKIAPTKA